MSKSETIIKVTGLEKVFKDFWRRPQTKALSGIDFEVRRGEVFGLLGPNGSGKSTTIKLLLGLLRPTAGHISIFGCSPDSQQVKHRLGYLPEDNVLPPQLTAEETLMYLGSLFSIDRMVCKERTKQLIEMVGLTHAKDRKVGEFSKGMARRIGIAQAVINDPELIILDEPTSGLDPIGCREIKDLILFLAKQGKTIIMSSHLLSDVQDICDYSMIIYGGVVKKKGKMDELLKKSELTTLTFPTLNAEELSEVTNRIPSKHLVVSNPSQSLEELFLTVVETASLEDKSSGARMGNGKAEYLEQEKFLSKFVTDEELEEEVEVETISSDALISLVANGSSTTPSPEQTDLSENHQDYDNITNDLLKELVK
ncbi:MAG: ABC transporter ATP-binding protein [Lentisphaeria bacterium]|nr:ABC transporter ATP-binding protein [Lentisphaeria bacterium]